MSTLNLHDLIFGFMRLGTFLTTLAIPEENLGSMNYNYIERMKVNTQFLTFSEKDRAKNSNYTLDDYFFSVPLVLEDNNIVRSPVKHRVNIVPIKEKNIVKSIYLINNKPFFGTPGVVTNLTIFVSWNFLKLDVDVDTDSVNKFRYYINLLIEAIMALVANDEKIIREEQVYRMDEILTNIFTKNILNGSSIFNFTKFEDQTYKVWEVYKTIDRFNSFPTALEKPTIQTLVDELIKASS